MIKIYSGALSRYFEKFTLNKDDPFYIFFPCKKTWRGIEVIPTECSKWANEIGSYRMIFDENNLKYNSFAITKEGIEIQISKNRLIESQEQLVNEISQGFLVPLKTK